MDYAEPPPPPNEEEGKESSESTSSSSRGFSPGQIRLENGVLTSPSSECSFAELNTASSQSSTSGNWRSPESDSAAAASVSDKAERVSDDVPYELSALSQTRQTPPPKLTQFNFRKRRSRGTPKNSPHLKMGAIREATPPPDSGKKSDKPPKKQAKMENVSEEVDARNMTSNNACAEDAGENAAVESGENAAVDTASTASQTDAQFVEDEATQNLTPRRVIIRAFARSRSEPCLLKTAKRSVSFVTRDDYLSDGEEIGEAPVLGDASRTRRSRSRGFFYTRSVIDASKITDSLKLLRIKLGRNPEGPSGDEIEKTPETDAEGTTPVEAKSRTKSLTSIKNKIIKKISSSTPMRYSGEREEETPGGITNEETRAEAVQSSDAVDGLAGDVSFGYSGVKVTEDNCSTTAMKGSPMSSRSASMREAPETDEDADKSKAAHAQPMVVHEAAQTPKWRLHPFGLPLGSKKKNKIQISKSHDEPRSEEKPVVKDVNEIKSAQFQEKSYFQNLDNKGLLSPAIRNIGNKYNLVSAYRLRSSAKELKDPALSPMATATSPLIRPVCVQMPKQAFTAEKTGVENGANVKQEVDLHEVDAGVKRIKGTVVEKNGEAVVKETSTEPALPVYLEPNEADNRVPLIKRTRKSFNIAVFKDSIVAEAEKHEFRREKFAKEKTPGRKPSFAERLRKFWGARDKTPKRTDANVGGDAQKEVRIAENATLGSHGATKSDTTASQLVGAEKKRIQAGRTVSVPIEPVSPEAMFHPDARFLMGAAGTSDEDGLDSNRSQNNSGPLNAIWRLQNLVASPSEEAVAAPVPSPPPPPPLPVNVAPVIQRKNPLGAVHWSLSDSSAGSMVEPDVIGDCANVNREAAATPTHRQDAEGKKQPRRVVPTVVVSPPEKMQIAEDEEEETAKPMEMDETETRPRWSRLNSAPPGGLVGSEGSRRPGDVMPRTLTLNDVDECSLDKWDSVKMTLEEAEAFFLGAFGCETPTSKSSIGDKDASSSKKTTESKGSKGNFGKSSANAATLMPFIFDEANSLEAAAVSDTYSPPRVELTEPQAATNSAGYRPYNHDESFSVEASETDTDSASEGRDMETGDCDAEATRTGTGNARRRPTSSRSGSVASAGSSGEKRKQCHLATPLSKDDEEEEGGGGKVRLESPESDEEGPPRARRVTRSRKKRSSLVQTRDHRNM